MLLETLYRNLAAILVFLTIAGVTWIYGGTRPDPLIEKLAFGSYAGGIAVFPAKAFV